MAVPKRKTSKSKTKMRRAANSKMVATGFVSCPQCHEPKLPHRVCPDCGYYKVNGDNFKSKVCIYNKVSPFIRLTTKDLVIVFNEDNSDKTNEIYNELIELTR